MAKKRLNITVDAAVVERARRYSQRHNTSISGLVGDFLSHLPEAEGPGEISLSATVGRLLGVAVGGPNRIDYRRHLLEKHNA